MPNRPALITQAEIARCIRAAKQAGAAGIRKSAHGLHKAAISACENAIKAANSPLEVNQLFDACMSLGVHLGGKRPQSTLCAYLAHETSTVRPIKRGVYWLKDAPIPQNSGTIL